MKLVYDMLGENMTTTLKGQIDPIDNARDRRFLLSWMKKEKACQEAIDWVEATFDPNTSLKELYDACPSMAWDGWLYLHVGIPYANIGINTVSWEILGPRLRAVMYAENAPEDNQQNARDRRLLLAWMKKEKACQEAIDWVEATFDLNTSLKQLYVACPNTTWDAWLDLHVGVPYVYTTGLTTPWSVIGPLLREAIYAENASENSPPLGPISIDNEGLVTFDNLVPMGVMSEEIDVGLSYTIRVAATDAVQAALVSVFNNYPIVLDDNAVIPLQTLRALTLYADRNYLTYSALLEALTEHGIITLDKG